MTVKSIKIPRGLKELRKKKRWRRHQRAGVFISNLQWSGWSLKSFCTLSCFWLCASRVLASQWSLVGSNYTSNPMLLEYCDKTRGACVESHQHFFFQSFFITLKEETLQKKFCPNEQDKAEDSSMKGFHHLVFMIVLEANRNLKGQQVVETLSRDLSLAVKLFWALSGHLVEILSEMFNCFKSIQSELLNNNHGVCIICVCIKQIKGRKYILYKGSHERITLLYIWKTLIQLVQKIIMSYWPCCKS